MIALAGLALAALLWWGLKSVGKSDPKRLAGHLRTAGGFAALGVAALLALRGRIDMATLVAGGGAYLLGWGSLPAFLGGGARAAASGRVSRMQSAVLLMEFDHDTGRLDGQVRSGRFAGRRLDDLGLPDLLDLRRTDLRVDPEGRGLLEAYLDRRHPGWREHAEPDADRGRRPDAEFGAMAEQEAYQILGLQPGADPAAIRGAHRSLIKRLHPDAGGSAYLASRVNRAKDILLDRHR